MVGRNACECLLPISLGLRGSPGNDTEVAAAWALGFRGWSGRDEVLVKPSLFLMTAGDCLCGGNLRCSTRGVPGSALEVEGPLLLVVRLVSTGCGLRGFLDVPSFPSLDPDCVFRVMLFPVTVWLLPSFCGGTGSSLTTSSIGLGRLACATANGPASLCSAGNPTLPNTRLDSTVTGSTFSCIFSLLAGSAPPNTIRCSLL